MVGREVCGQLFVYYTFGDLGNSWENRNGPVVGGFGGFGGLLDGVNEGEFPGGGYSVGSQTRINNVSNLVTDVRSAQLNEANAQTVGTTC